MSSIQSSILYTAILAVIGYFIFPLVDSGLPSQFVFAMGLLLGGVFVAIVSQSKPDHQAKEEQSQGPSKTIYVGNLPYRANESVIKELFEKFGEVYSVRLLKDRQTGKRRGFGFVEMEEKAGDKAIKALNDSEFQQRTLKVREAKERPEKQQDSELQAEA